MKIKILSCIAAILCLLAGGATPAFAQGTAFTYEGRLNTNGSPAQGIYDFRSAIYDAVANGTQIGGTLTNSATGVTNGLFNLTLDFGPGIFTGPARWLEIGVRTNGGVFTNMTPRTALLAVPYAVYAGQAGTVTNGAISVSQLQTPGTPTNGQALTYNGTSLVWQTPAGGSTAYVAKAGDTMTGALNLLAPAVLNFGDQTRQMLNLYDFGIYHYGIGVQNSTLYQRAAVGGGGFAWYAGGSHTNTQNSPGSGGVTLMTLDSSGNLTAPGLATFNGGVSGTDSSGSTTSAGVTGTSSAGEGVSGVGGNNGVSGITASGGSAHAGVFGKNVGASGIGVSGVALGISGTGASGVADQIGGTGVYGRGSSWAGYFQGNVNVTGSLNVGSSFLTVNGAGGEQAYLGGDGLGTDIQIGSRNPAMTTVACYNTANNAYMHVNCSSITIFGGADLAEPFQITAADNEILQGAVVVIDEANPGRLKLSDRPYDTRVAGVVSGAGGINPGIQMQQKGLLGGGKNISLTGRVYVLADASNGAIKPGDLLTTSNTPGHAMKVTNHNQAQGAILGKAMSSLKEGKGMVLVLVTLQ